MATTDLPAGYIQFFDSSLPSLEAGTYTISVQQDAKSTYVPTGQNDPLNASFSATQAFTVMGPQFALGAGDVHSVYPPPSSQGQFSERLPNIVLTKKGLPWARTLDGSTPPHGTTFDPSIAAPWMALLLFQPDEILLPTGTTDAQNPTRKFSYTVDELLNPAPFNDLKVLGPQLTQAQLGPTDTATTQTQAINISTAQFVSLLPRRYQNGNTWVNEPAYLAHVRQVNTGNKEILGMDEDGWFSTLVGNRFPTQNTQCIAHLVSLEGFQDYLDGDASKLSAYGAVRLVSLVSWTFFAQPETYTFAGLMAALDDGLLQLNLPSGKTAGTDAEKSVQQAFDWGYAPLEYTTRMGEKTVAWYRGPLLPVPTVRVLDQYAPFETSEAAMIYDQTTGMFDLSFAVAWQIGRLLALSDGAFAAAMLEWKQAGNQLTQLTQDRQDLFQSYSETLDFPDTLDAMLAPQLHRRVVAQFLATKLAPQVVAGVAAKPLISVRDPSGLHDHPRQLPGVLSKADLLQALHSGQDPHDVLYEMVFGKPKKRDS